MSATSNKTVPSSKKTDAEKARLKAERKAAKQAEKAARPAPTPFRTTISAEHLNGDGLLTVANVYDFGYNDEKHEELAREDFASESLWLTFRASRLRLKAQALLAKADQLESEAKSAASFGDPTKRAAVKRIAKLGAAFAELRKTLESEGVDLSEILKSAGL